MTKAILARNKAFVAMRAKPPRRRGITAKTFAPTPSRIGKSDFLIFPRPKKKEQKKTNLNKLQKWQNRSKWIIQQNFNNEFNVLATIREVIRVESFVNVPVHFYKIYLFIYLEQRDVKSSRQFESEAKTKQFVSYLLAKLSRVPLMSPPAFSAVENGI